MSAGLSMVFLSRLFRSYQWCHTIETGSSSLGDAAVRIIGRRVWGLLIVSAGCVPEIYRARLKRLYRLLDLP